MGKIQILPIDPLALPSAGIIAVPGPTVDPTLIFTENWDGATPLNNWTEHIFGVNSFALTSATPTPPTTPNAVKGPLDGVVLSPGTAVAELLLRNGVSELDVEIEARVHCNATSYIPLIICRAQGTDTEPCYAAFFQDVGATWNTGVIHFSGTVRTVLAFVTGVVDPAGYIKALFTVTGTGAGIVMKVDIDEGAGFVNKITHGPSASFQIDTAGGIGFGANGNTASTAIRARMDEITARTA